jgi:hypothetical protein
MTPDVYPPPQVVLPPASQSGAAVIERAFITLEQKLLPAIATACQPKSVALGGEILLPC